MSHESETRSSLARFFDSFFQERNIRWMLGIGMLLLLGSSMMLVKSQWQDYSPFLKYFVLIAYTTGVFIWGEVTYFRLGLRKTATVLQSLTVLLLPLSFAALQWIRPADGLTMTKFAEQIGLLVLLAMNFAVACVAATRIFKHFLRRSQPTFVAAYLMLCVAGAVVPLLSGIAVILAMGILWAVFTIGTIKVNRHIFWLTEEQRWPRVIGFFPIALLGTQFVTLFALNLTPHISMQWMGLACALIALPVMLTADTILGVYQQRTGDLVRPLPWSLILPTGVGLILCVTGVALAATALPLPPFAMVPTAALVAAMMGITAYRTRHAGFVWGMLIAVLLTYQFSPAFFLETAKQILQIGAGALGKDRLPYAFYGLTYLPLLIGLIMAGWWTNRRGIDTFAGPIRQFTTGLTTILLCTSLGDPTAIFPVGLVVSAVFALQAMLFHDRRLMVGAVAGWISSAVGLTPFLVTVLEVAVPADMLFFSLGFSAATLLWPGRWLDRRRRFAAEHPATGDTVYFRLCQATSMVMSLMLSVFWLYRFGLQPLDTGWMSGTILALLLAVHAYIWVKPGLGEAAIVFAGLVGLTQSFQWNVPAETIHATAALILAAMWWIAPRMQLNSDSRLARVFGGPLQRVSLAGLAGLLVYNTATHCVSASGIAAQPIAWIPSVLVILWAFDAARRVPHEIYSAAGCVSLLTFVSCAWMSFSSANEAANWLPAIWAAIGLTAVPLCVRFGKMRATPAGVAPNRSAEALMRPVVVCTLGLLVSVGVASLFVFTTPLRVAGGIAAAGLLLLAVLRSEPLVRRFAGIVANWQFISLVVQLFTPENVSILDLNLTQAAGCSLPVAAVAAFSLLAWQLVRRDSNSLIEHLLLVHQGLLRILVGLALYASLSISHRVLNPAEVLFAVIPFLSLISVELWRAVASGKVERVWWAQAIATMGVGYFLLFNVISLESSVCMYLTLGAGVLLCGAGRAAEKHPRSAVLSQPFILTGTLLPLLTVGLGVMRQWVSNPEWHGVNSLALLSAAAFYFWRGIDRKEKPFLVLSAAILNVGLALLWHELKFSDPQFFMIPIGISILWLVQILKHEIPDRLHDPLRYLGALVILVSPVFHIVGGGSWIHLVTLMVASIAVTLVAIGLRIRAITYTGTAFLVADVVAMVVRGSIDHPMLLWVVGILVGVCVIALAAYCEKHREQLLSRMRRLAIELESWD